MIYYIYKITNLCNDKIYIGIHKTQSLDDGYMGSGKLLKAAIKKYGKDNFKKEVLETFKNEKDMIAREQELVTEEFISSEDNYNIMLGGKFGSLERNNLSFKGKRHSETTIEKIRSASIGRNHSEETKKKISENNFSKTDPEKQKEHAKKAGSYVRSEEHKRKISEAIKNKLQSGNYKPGRKKSVGGKSIGADTTL
jgi:group I intron endonuclease